MKYIKPILFLGYSIILVGASWLVSGAYEEAKLEGKNAAMQWLNLHMITKQKDGTPRSPEEIGAIVNAQFSNMTLSLKTYYGQIPEDSTKKKIIDNSKLISSRSDAIEDNEMTHDHVESSMAVIRCLANLRSPRDTPNCR